MIPYLKPVDVLYFFEHREREFETACVVSNLLQKRYGRTVVVQNSWTEAYRSLFAYQPKVLVVPYCYTADSLPVSLFKRAYGPAITYLNLGFEQILPSFFATPKTPGDSFVREEVFHCVWNDDFRDRLVGHGVKQGMVTVTGSPQQALYSDRYGYLHTDKLALAQESGLDATREWIVFPMNYLGAFLSQKAIAGRLKIGFPVDKMGPYVEFCRESLSVVLDWVLAAADRFPDKLFIIRPRPGWYETEGAYQRLLLQKRAEVPENLRVVKHLAVREWILASRAVFSSFSTTLLDAAFARKPTYSLAPFPIPEWLTGDWTHLVPSVSTQEEFIEAVQQPDGVSSASELVAYADRAFGVSEEDPLEQTAFLLNRLLVESSQGSGLRAKGKGPSVGIGFLASMTIRALEESVEAFLGRHGVRIRESRAFIGHGDTQRDMERTLKLMAEEGTGAKA